MVVTIVSLGYSSHLGKQFAANILDDDSWTVIDCRKWLKKDWSTVVGKGENGSHPQTTKTVVSQDGYFELIHKVADEVLSGARKVALCCNWGCHRSDTARRHVVDLLNSCLTFEGDRMYNAMSMSVEECYGWKDFKVVCKDIEKWQMEPWVLQTGPENKQSCYGYHSCMKSKDSAVAWLKCWELFHTEKKKCWKPKEKKDEDEEELDAEEQPKPKKVVPRQAAPVQDRDDEEWGKASRGSRSDRANPYEGEKVS